MNHTILSSKIYKIKKTNPNIDFFLKQNKIIYIDLNQEEDILIKQLKVIKKHNIEAIGVYSKKLPKYLILNLLSRYLKKTIYLKII